MEVHKTLSNGLFTLAFYRGKRVSAMLLNEKEDCEWRPKLEHERPRPRPSELAPGFIIYKENWPGKPYITLPFDLDYAVSRFTVISNIMDFRHLLQNNT